MDKSEKKKIKMSRSVIPNLGSAKYLNILLLLFLCIKVDVLKYFVRLA
jgi:hypothetical protein